MRIKASTILLPLAGVFALMLYLQKGAAKLLNYVIQRVQLNFQGTTPVLRVDVGVQNPSNTDFTIKSIAGDAIAGGQVIGNFSMFQTIVVASNAQTTLPIDIRLNTLGVVADLIKVITQGYGNTTTITLDGNVNANGFVQPLKLEYKLM